MGDMDPEAQEALKKLQALWDAAPANAAMAGHPVQLSGFMVPLDPAAPQIDAFVLMPYFGGCIHAPGPPASQMVRVLPEVPIATSDRGNSAVTVSGTLRIAWSATPMGATAYTIARARVQPRAM
jgi:hypothetical protein